MVSRIEIRPAIWLLSVKLDEKQEFIANHCTDDYTDEFCYACYERDAYNLALAILNSQISNPNEF